ncbi:MAG TPA: YIP1 family protein [Candidatus Methanoperedenaceae archaeon]|nr:YIP1 family protein [Candidatus Methanoperedenaceae archaeon]
MDLVDKITGVLTNPKSTMKEVAERPMIEEGLLIVGLNAAIAALSAYITFTKVIYKFPDVPGSSQDIQTIAILAGIVGSLIGVFIMWVVFAGILHIISLAIGGEGRFYPGMLVIYAYSMLPMPIGGIIEAILLYLTPVVVTIDMSGAGTGTGNPMAGLIDHPYYQAATAIGLIASVLSLFLMFHGVQSVQKLSAKRAVIPVGILAVITIVPSVIGWFMF